MPVLLSARYRFKTLIFWRVSWNIGYSSSSLFPLIFLLSFSFKAQSKSGGIELIKLFNHQCLCNIEMKRNSYGRGLFLWVRFYMWLFCLIWSRTFLTPPKCLVVMCCFWGFSDLSTVHCCVLFSLNICLLNSIWSILLDRSQTRLQIVLIPPALFIPVEYDAMERQKLIDAVPDSVTPLIIYEETTDIWINVRIWISALSDSLLFETPCAALGQSWCCCAAEENIPVVQVLCLFLAESCSKGLITCRGQKDVWCESRAALLEVARWSES